MTFTFTLSAMNNIQMFCVCAVLNRWRCLTFSLYFHFFWFEPNQKVLQSGLYRELQQTALLQWWWLSLLFFTLIFSELNFIELCCIGHIKLKQTALAMKMTFTFTFSLFEIILNFHFHICFALSLFLCAKSQNCAAHCELKQTAL